MNEGVFRPQVRDDDSPIQYEKRCEEHVMRELVPLTRESFRMILRMNECQCEGI